MMILGLCLLAAPGLELEAGRYLGPRISLDGTGVVPLSARSISAGFGLTYAAGLSLGAGSSPASPQALVFSAGGAGWALTFRLPYVVGGGDALGQQRLGNYGFGVTAPLVDRDDLRISLLTEARFAAAGRRGARALWTLADLPAYAPRLNSLTLGAGMASAAGPVHFGVNAGGDLHRHAPASGPAANGATLWMEAWGGWPLSLPSQGGLELTLSPMLEVASRALVGEVGSASEALLTVGLCFALRSFAHDLRYDVVSRTAISLGFQSALPLSGRSADSGAGRIVLALDLALITDLPRYTLSRRAAR